MAIDATLYRGHAYFTVTRIPESTDITAASADFFSNCPTPVPKHVIWDFTQGSVSAITVNRFREVAKAGLPFAKQRGDGAKTALYVSREPDALVCKAYIDMTADSTPVRRQVFTRFSELLSWLED